MRIITLQAGEHWEASYAREAAVLAERLGAAALELHHIGSTAIPGILAKPVIDIIVEVSSLEAIDARTPALAALGYEAMGEFGIAGRRFFRKGGDRRSHHLHAFEPGSQETRRMLAFRDYLRAHRPIALEYEGLKRELAARYRCSPDDYTRGKSGFVRRVERDALRWQAAQPGKVKQSIA